MFRTLIELPAARLAIAEVDTETRAAARAACERLIEELSQGQSGKDLSISKSHSGRWVAVGVSSQASIGVDIELVRPRAHLAEVADWLELDATDEPTFYAHWTLRESLAKSRGGSVLDAHVCEGDLRMAARHPGELIDADGYSALCGKLEGGIYYSLVLNHPPSHEAIRCA